MSMLGVLITENCNYDLMRESACVCVCERESVREEGEARECILEREYSSERQNVASYFLPSPLFLLLSLFLSLPKSRLITFPPNFLLI